MKVAINPQQSCGSVDGSGNCYVTGRAQDKQKNRSRAGGGRLRRLSTGESHCAISAYVRTMPMRKRRFPMRAEIGAAVFAAMMFMFVFVPNASAQRVGCLPDPAGDNIVAHGLCP